MGAKVTSISGDSVADSVLSFAHEHNITKIVAGKPLRPRWYEILRGSVIDQIIRDSGSIDVNVVSDISTTTPVTKKEKLNELIYPYGDMGWALYSS